MNILSRSSVLILLLFPLLNHAIDLGANANDEQPLPVDKAFKPTILLKDKKTIVAEWVIEKKYYMYRKQFKFVSRSANVTLGDAIVPPGKIKKDPLFGEVKVFRNKVSIEIPIKEVAKGATEILLETRSQGCADIGLCYPPVTKTFKLSLASVGAIATETANIKKEPTTAKKNASKTSEKDSKNAAAALKKATTPELNLGLQEEQSFLPVEKAFIYKVDHRDLKSLKISWKIAPGYYMYKKEFKFKLINAPPGVTLGEAIIPPGKMKKDPIFGNVKVFYKQVAITVPVKGLKTGQNAKVKMRFQGCADAGLCYPPETKTIAIGDTASKLINMQSEAELSEEEEIEKAFHSNIFILIIVMIGAGLVLAFTACLYPLIPIVTSIITSQGENISRGKGFFLALVYVESMAITFGILGAFIGFGGNATGITIFFQQTTPLVIISIFFVLLALAMFGVFTIQMPSALQSKLNALSNKQKGGTVLGVAFMGVLSSLIAGPCAAPGLIAAFTGIAESGSAFVGFIAMFAMGNGIGLPLLVVGAGGGELLKKPGPWMQTVKASGGIMILAVALVFVERAFGKSYPLPIMLLWATWFVSAGVFMRALEPLGENPGGWRFFWKGVGIAFIIYGVLVAFGGMTGGKDWTNPLHHIKFSADTETVTSTKMHEPIKSKAVASGSVSDNPKRVAHIEGLKTVKKGLLTFIRIKTKADFERELKRANEAGFSVMLDFYADWCTYCIQFDNYVFNKPRVFNALKNTILLQADVTKNDAKDKALIKRVKIFLPPAILFFNTDGKEIRKKRVNGFMKAEKFLKRVESTLK